MLCPKCGFYSEKEENVCPECGNILRQASDFRQRGAQAIRQGKRAREAAKTKQPRPAAEPMTGKHRKPTRQETVEMPVVQDTRVLAGEEEEWKTGNEDSGPAPAFERRRRTVYDEEADESTAMRYLAAHEDYGSAPHLVNWVKISIFAILIVILLLGGGWFFINRTDAGQRFLARMGKDATSVALWAVGDEQLNRGEIDKAIESFEKARKKDEAEGVIDVDGLLTLGSAYEAAGMTDKAADLYEEIYTQTPSRTEAYVNHIRILQNKGGKDLAKAGDLMKLAYEKTGEKTFLTQRTDLLPAPPEVKPIAGYYETKKTLVFSSYQGYDVWFTFDDEAKLPYEGQKATREGFVLDEGIYNLRAVTVYGDLVSDELKATYKIIMPSPQTPRATLAPNTYKTSQRVRLKPGLDDENDTSITIYYTVDGSTPDSDSPIYDGEPILLPNGWVTLKAIAVNRYRKLSNMLEIKYKIEANPKPKSAFDSEDTVDKLKINQTSQNEFFNLYSQGTAAGAVQPEGFETECRRFDYPWGYAVMTLSKKNWVLVEVSFHSSGVLSGPRGTQIGDSEAAVVGKFRDMQQVESKSGNRGLYAVTNGTGKIWLQENNEKIIRYRYAVDSHWVQLEYLVGSSGTVKNIDLKYIP